MVLKQYLARNELVGHAAQILMPSSPRRFFRRPEEDS
jgi:hypothetical protein